MLYVGFTYILFHCTFDKYTGCYCMDVARRSLKILIFPKSKIL